MKYYTSTTEYNCGIDLHARQMYICLMDRQGKKLVHTNVRDNNFKFFLKLVQPYQHSLTVCCECMFGWYWLADACQGAGLTFVLAHALYVKARCLRPVDYSARLRYRCPCLQKRARETGSALCPLFPSFDKGKQVCGADSATVGR